MLEIASAGTTTSTMRHASMVFPSRPHPPHGVLQWQGGGVGVACSIGCVAAMPTDQPPPLYDPCRLGCALPPWFLVKILLSVLFLWRPDGIAVPWGVSGLFEAGLSSLVPFDFMRMGYLMGPKCRSPQDHRYPPPLNFCVHLVSVRVKGRIAHVFISIRPAHVSIEKSYRVLVDHDQTFCHKHTLIPLWLGSGHY